jgi:hypothetical protein
MGQATLLSLGAMQNRRINTVSISSCPYHRSDKVEGARIGQKLIWCMIIVYEFGSVKLRRRNGLSLPANTGSHAMGQDKWVLCITTLLTKQPNEHDSYSLSSQGTGFNTTPVCVGFACDKVAMEQVFLRVLRFSPVGIIPLELYVIHSSITDAT